MKAMDPRDKALALTLPVVMAPRHSRLEPVAVGCKRLLAGHNGLYLEVRSPALHACLLLQPMNHPLPYGAVKEFVRPAAGPIPVGLMRAAVERAVAACPNETAMALVLDTIPGVGSRYRLQSLPIHAADPLHVQYDDVIDDDQLVVDIHSHGQARAFFSDVDDQSDRQRRGPYLAFVLGTCQAAHTTTLNARLCCAPYLLPMRRALIPIDWQATAAVLA